MVRRNQNSEQVRKDRKAYRSKAHIPKVPAEPKAQPRGEGNAKKSTVTAGKKKAADKKGG